MKFFTIKEFYLEFYLAVSYVIITIQKLKGEKG